MIGHRSLDALCHNDLCPAAAPGKEKSDLLTNAYIFMPSSPYGLMTRMLFI